MDKKYMDMIYIYGYDKKPGRVEKKQEIVTLSLYKIKILQGLIMTAVIFLTKSVVKASASLNGISL
jgi:hypothetical protein